MWRPRYLLLPAAMAVVFACGHSGSAEPATGGTPPSVGLEETFSIGRGRTVVVEGESLELTFASAAERADGRVEVSVEIAKAGAEPALVVLSAEPEGEREATGLGYRVTLIGIERAGDVATIKVARAAAPAAEAPAPRAAVAPGQPFALRLGEEVSVEGGLRLRFASVVNDSRCPEGVDCVWEGNAEIAVEASKAAEPPALLRLNTHRSAATEATYLGHTVRLLGLDPHPKYGDQGAERRYTASLVVLASS